MPEKLKIKKKDFSVEVLKGFAILVVIFGHIASPITNFIFSFHMPLFFFISGFFIKINNNSKYFLVKNFKRTMVYFFIFAIIGFLVTYFRDIFLGRETGGVYDALVGIFFYMDMEHLKHYGFVLWFLPALFWSKNINYLLIKHIKNKLIISFLILISFSLVVIFKVKLPFVLDIGVLASFWVFMGYIFYNFFKEKIIEKYYYFIIIIPLILFFLPIPALNLSLRFFAIPLYNIVYSSLIIIFLFALFSRYSYNNKVSNLLSFLGKNSFFLFIFHPYTNNIVNIIVERYFCNLWYVKFILSFTLLYLFLIIYRKYLNKGILKYV